MGLNRTTMRKYLFNFLVAGLFLWGVFSLGYIYRFRKTHIMSSDSYKEDIAQLKEREEYLLGEIEKLKKQIVSQSECITDSASLDYEFFLDPQDIGLNHMLADVDPRIIVAGHLYGSGKSNSIPSQTLIDALPQLERLNPDLFVGLGDLTYMFSDESFLQFQNSFLSKVDFPFINAPGNHDFSQGRELYEDYFGQTFFYTRYPPAQIIVLDTELANCYTSGRQKEMLEEALNLGIQDDEINYIFIFMHKLLFLDQNQSLRNRANGVCSFGSNYDEIRDEILLPAATEKDIYLLAGDVGAYGGNLSPFYDRDENHHIHAIAVGLGDSDEDILLQVDLTPDRPEFQLIPLGNKDFLPFETYTPEYWTNHE